MDNGNNCIHSNNGYSVLNAHWDYLCKDITIHTETWIVSYFYYMRLKIFEYGNACRTAFNTKLSLKFYILKVLRVESKIPNEDTLY